MGMWNSMIDRQRGLKISWISCNNWLRSLVGNLGLWDSNDSNENPNSGYLLGLLEICIKSNHKRSWICLRKQNTVSLKFLSNEIVHDIISWQGNDFPNFLKLRKQTAVKLFPWCTGSQINQRLHHDHLRNCYKESFCNSSMHMIMMLDLKWNFLTRYQSGIDILTLVWINGQVFTDVVSHRLVNRYRRFGGTLCLRLYGPTVHSSYTVWTWRWK
jgi:hypothetical protein